MRWYEYKMEADDLAAPDDLKAKLLAMTSQLTEEEKNQPMMQAAAPAQPAPEKKKKGKLIHFPRKQVGMLAACLAVCVVGYGAFATGQNDCFHRCLPRVKSRSARRGRNQGGRRSS